MKYLNAVKIRLLQVCVVSLLGGCAVLPKQLDSQGQDDGKHFSRKVVTQNLNELHISQTATSIVTKHDTDSFYQSSFVPGDTIRLTIAGMDQYDGLYKVTSEGKLDLPFAQSFSATGLSREGLIDSIEDELVRLNWFYRQSVEVDLSLVALAPVEVSVVGAVFNPGRVLINNQPIEKPDSVIQHASGAYTSGRKVVSALSAAGGLRPDADISNVYLKRGIKVLHLSLKSIVNGNGFNKSPRLINGDQLIVPSTGVVDSTLIKPSQVTPPGMRVFMSNLTAPALSNAQSAIGADSTRLPYGSSLLDSVVAANCIGGTHQANASRSVVLITRNLGSKQQIIVRRSINQLLANSSTQSVNPFMMPNDAIACYDSRFSNFRDVARGIGEVISPLLLGRLL